MPTCWDDVLGLALELIRALRSEGMGERAADLLAALTSGCNAQELALALREEALALGDGLPAAVETQRRTLLLGLRELMAG